MEIFTSARKGFMYCLLVAIFSMAATSVTAQELEVVGNSTVIANGDTTPSLQDNTYLGSVSVENGSTTVIYTLKNIGGNNLTVGNVTITGAHTAFYTVSQQPAASVSPGGQTTFSITFHPTTIGTKNITVHFSTNDADESNFSFAVSGLGVRTYKDSDGDGISDNMDLDDDNDGIPDELEQLSCLLSPIATTAEHVFLNETFGTGTTKGQININIPGATCTYCYEDGIVGPNTAECPSQSSWILDDGEYVVTHKIAGTESWDPDNIHGDLAWNGSEDHTPGDVNGRMAVFNASYTPGIFYETTIHGVVPNVPVVYEFWAMNIMSQHTYGGSILPNITVDFLDMGGNLLSTFNTGDLGRCGSDTSNNDCALSQWMQFQMTVNLGDNSSFVIRFKNNAPGGGGNDLALDDISIRQRYCDSDGDGVANIFDLDSDNDGIPDVEEAGFKHLTAQRSVLAMGYGQWTDSNANGWHDAAEVFFGAGASALKDTDGDGTPDYLDLDSDNDSRFDIDEAGLFNGDGDIDGDGTGDGPDTDGDGILDIFDADPSFGSQVRPFADDSDGDGIADYLQIDSNNDGVSDIASGLFASFDANGDGKIDGSSDMDRDGILDAFDTADMTFGSPRDIDMKLYLELDGRNDYATSNALLDGRNSVTMMGWIKRSATDHDAAVFGQDGFKFRISSNGQLSLIAQGQTIVYNVNLDLDRWYHIAATYDGAAGKVTVYLNGAYAVEATGSQFSSGLEANNVPFTIGREPGSASGYFAGSVEEVRLFSSALSEGDIQKIVYQEIDKNGSLIRGSVIPKDIPALNWNSLLAYYRMDRYKGDVCDNLVTDGVDEGTAESNLRIYNVKNFWHQSAPMPFVTTQAGDLAEAVSQNNFVFGQDVFKYDWSIVKIGHDMELFANQSSLGLFIEEGVTVRADNNIKVENSWYLKLDGKLDLVDRSQLVQKADSDLAVNSKGFIERDQQGTTNKFNYNYWSSMVGPVSESANNLSFTVAETIKDGTDPENPQDITWITGITPPATSPITLSGYWIFKFQNLSNSYSNWGSVGPNGILNAGQGFTMKGSAVAEDKQNYVFTGKPNNGDINVPIAAGNLNLAGNPYPSAIDADQFIRDNTDSMVGTLYFWEHYSTNYTHITELYQGGYATRTLVGGVPPVAPPGISGEGSSSRIPNRFIPVGQGFFVKGNGTGGNIKFNNGQRAFVREENSESFTTFRQASTIDNEEDQFEGDSYARIRLGYDFVNGFHRQVLLGFMDDKANASFNSGYDAVNNDSNPDEMTFKLGGNRCVILGEGYFDISKSFPLEVKSLEPGTTRFTLDGTENLDPNQAIYIFDAANNIYHDLREGDFEVTVNAGLTPDRFFLKFTAPVTLGTDGSEMASITLKSAGDYLGIRNQDASAFIKKVQIVNMVGQTMGSYASDGMDQQDIRIPTQHLSTGTYLAQITTASGTTARKFVIK